MLGARLDDHDLVLGRSRSRCRARDVVDDDRVEHPFAPASRARARPGSPPCSAAKPMSVCRPIGAAPRRRRARPRSARADSSSSSALSSDLVLGRARRAGSRPTAAAISSTSAARRTPPSARRSSSAAVSTSTRLHPGRCRQRDVRGDQRHVGPARAPPRSASAMPIRPLERLPMKRTASMRLARAAGADQHPEAVPRARRGAAARPRPRAAGAPGRGAARRRARRARRAAPRPGSITCTPRSRSVREVGLRGGVLVHAVVHRRRDERAGRCRRGTRS